MATLVAGLNDTIGNHTGTVPVTYAPNVNGNMYGGGKLASIVGNTHVNLVSGEVGVMTVHQIHQIVDEQDHLADSIIPGLGIPYYHLSGGRVYGGGQGDDASAKLGLVKGNTNVYVSGTAKIYNCVYGGGMLGSVGNYTYYYSI